MVTGHLYFSKIITMFCAIVSVAWDKTTKTIPPTCVIDFHTMESFKMSSDRVVSSSSIAMMTPNDEHVVPPSCSLTLT